MYVYTPGYIARRDRFHISAWLQNCEYLISFANDGEQYFEQSDIKNIALLYCCLKKLQYPLIEGVLIPFDRMELYTFRLKGNK